MKLKFGFKDILTLQILRKDDGKSRLKTKYEDREQRWLVCVHQNHKKYTVSKSKQTLAKI